MESLEGALEGTSPHRWPDLGTMLPVSLQFFLHWTRRRWVATIAVGVAVVAVTALFIRAVLGFDGVTITGAPGETKETPIPKGEVIASGDGWELFIDDKQIGGPKWRSVCYTLVGPSLYHIACNYVNRQYAGLARVDSLRREGALFYGTVATRVAGIEVRFEDGSRAEPGVFSPPKSIEIEENLFVLALHDPEGSAIATLLDERERRLATAEFSWPHGEGGILFAFDPV